MEKAEFSSQYSLSEIPPIFKIAETKKIEKSSKNMLLYRVSVAILLLTILIVLRLFFPEIYIVINSWLTEKLGSATLPV